MYLAGSQEGLGPQQEHGSNFLGGCIDPPGYAPGMGSFTYDVHQKMGFLDPPPPLVTKF